MKTAGIVVFALLLALLFVMKLKPEWITRYFVDEPERKVDVSKMEPLPAPQPGALTPLDRAAVQPAQPAGTLTPLDRSKLGQPQPLKPMPALQPN